MKRIVATLAAAALSFFLIVSPAHAQDDEASLAADWISSQTAGDPGQQAEQVIALVSAGNSRYDDEIDIIVTNLKSKAADYTSDSPEAAAKLAIVAAATGNDASSFGDVNLTGTIIESVRSDGSFGSFPGPFASGLAMVALARTGSQVPAAMISYLLSEPYILSDGCFTFAEGEAADPDSTSMAILGLQAAESSDPALAKAQDCLAGLQQSDGSFQAYSPVNSTGLAGPLLLDDARDKAREYVASHQLADGALTTGGEGGDAADLLASTQGILVLTNQTYLTVGTNADIPDASGQSDTGNGDVADTGSGVALGLAIVAVAAIGLGVVLVTRRRLRA